MEINGIFGMGKGIELPLSQEQKDSLEAILAKYDPEKMTREDMKAMREEMAEAGIPRSRETMVMLKEAGFSPAAMPKHGTEALMGEENQTQSEKGELWDLYQQLQNGEITEAEFQARIQHQIQAGSLISLFS
jgi:hypothetical protein